jgi:16S rRNA (guanine966-N2)-methyltransferase
MRVIAGSQKGRRLLSPEGTSLRPTSDRVKEALFSILAPRIPGARFLDLYAGTGAIGIEAMSRGARHAAFVESHADSLRLLRDNLVRCGLTAQAEIHSCTATAFLKRELSDDAYDVVFADPPYQETDDGLAMLSALSMSAIISPASTIILEHGSKSKLSSEIGRLSLVRQYRYGDTTLSLFSPQAEGVLTP